MRWIRLREATLSNFRSFAGVHKIPFDESGLTLVEGYNPDTKVRSGVGKTNLLLATAWALDFCPIPFKSLQTRKAQSTGSTYVELRFDTDTGPLVVRRGEGAFLTGCGEDVKGADATSAAVDRVFGMPAKLRRALTYRPQKKGTPFISMADADKKSFLVELIPGTAELEKVVKEASVYVDSSQAAVVAARSKFEAAEAVLASMTAVQLEVVDEGPWTSRRERADYNFSFIHSKLVDQKAKLEALVTTRNVALNEAGRAAADNAAAIRRSAPTIPKDPKLERFEEMAREMADQLSRVEVEDEQRRERWDAEMSLERSALSRRGVPLRQLSVDRHELIRLRAELEKIDKGKCPTCAQVWDKSLQHWFEVSGNIEALSKRVAELEALEVEVHTAEIQLSLKSFQASPELLEASRMEEAVKGRLHAARAAQARLEGEARGLVESKALAVEAAFAESRMRELTREHGEVDEAGRRLRELEEALAAAKFEVNSATVALSNIRTNNKAAIDRGRRDAIAREVAEGNVHSSKALLSVTEAELNAQLDFKDLAKAFLDRVFDEVLAEVSEEANQMLGRFQNTSHLSLRFDPEAENSKGEIKNKIVPRAMFDGEERPLEHEASGGQMTSVELATDLAVGAVAARHSGVKLGWLFLDESFVGHCPVTKESCLDILKAYAEEGRLVVVVDHCESFKSMFDRVIEVEYRDGRSEIKTGL